MAVVPDIITPAWRPVPRVHALCTTRIGGESLAPWNTWNLGEHVGDAAATVAANRQVLRVACQLPAEPCWLRQVHGTVVADLDQYSGEPRIADAAITSTPNTLCVVLTADCVPVLLAAENGSAVAAAHAGWRGLAAGVLENTVMALRGRVAARVRLQAWLGPGIGPLHFEVGDDVRDAFLAIDAAATTAFAPGAGDRWLCDLYTLARQRLAALGISSVTGGEHCTYADAGRFFSHRRDVQHLRASGTGRMASLIWMQQ